MNLSSLACPNRAGMNVLGATCENQKALMPLYHPGNKERNILLKNGCVNVEIIYLMQISRIQSQKLGIVFFFGGRTIRTIVGWYDLNI
jgi:hypothetical protein